MGLGDAKRKVDALVHDNQSFAVDLSDTGVRELGTIEGVIFEVGKPKPFTGSRRRP